MTCCFLLYYYLKWTHHSMCFYSFHDSLSMIQFNERFLFEFFCFFCFNVLFSNLFFIIIDHIEFYLKRLAGGAYKRIKLNLTNASDSDRVFMYSCVYFQWNEIDFDLFIQIKRKRSIERRKNQKWKKKYNEQSKKFRTRNRGTKIQKTYSSLHQTRIEIHFKLKLI